VLWNGTCGYKSRTKPNMRTPFNSSYLSFGLQFHLHGVRTKGKQMPYNEYKGMNGMATNYEVSQT